MPLVCDCWKVTDAEFIPARMRGHVAGAMGAALPATGKGFLAGPRTTLHPARRPAHGGVQLAVGSGAGPVPVRIQGVDWTGSRAGLELESQDLGGGALGVGVLG